MSDRYPTGYGFDQMTNALMNGGGGGGAPASLPADPMTGGSAFSPTGFNPTATGTSDLTGFAGQYSGMPLFETIFDDPTAVLPDVFPGIDTMGPGYNMLSNLPFDPYLMYYMTALSGGDTMGSGVNEYTNWLNEMYTDVGGGQWFNFGDLMGALTGAGDGSQLDFALSHLPAGEASRVLQGMLGIAATVGLDPLAARAFQSVIPGMMAGMSNTAIKTDPADQGAGFNDPRDYLRRGMANLGLGY